MKRKHVIIIVILLSVLVTLVIIHDLTRPFDLGTYNREITINNNDKQYVFIVRKWGLAGNHEQIELITPARDTCVFYTNRLLYKKTSKGIIIIPPSKGVFVDENIQDICRKDTSIIIQTMNNPDSTEYLYDSYKKMGYEKIETSVK